jgi:hypothetical protein
MIGGLLHRARRGAAADRRRLLALGLRHPVPHPRRRSRGDPHRRRAAAAGGDGNDRAWPSAFRGIGATPPTHFEM